MKMADTARNLSFRFYLSGVAGRDMRFPGFKCFSAQRQPRKKTAQIFHSLDIPGQFFFYGDLAKFLQRFDRCIHVN